MIKELKPIIFECVMLGLVIIILVALISGIQFKLDLQLISRLAMMGIFSYILVQLVKSIFKTLKVKKNGRQKDKTKSNI